MIDINALMLLEEYTEITIQQKISVLKQVILKILYTKLVNLQEKLFLEEMPKVELNISLIF
ncbi:MAG: hypothetical protein AB8U25_04985 [Rickettsiales endosymbiont of Dermacentor nuttalli]